MPVTKGTSTVVTSGALSTSHTVGSGATALVVRVVVWNEESATCTSSVDGSFGAALATAALGGYGRVYIFGLVAPTVGAHTITIAGGPSDTYIFDICDIYGSDAVSPFGDVDSETVGPEAVSLTLTTADGGLVLDVVNSEGGPIAANAGQTESSNAFYVFTYSGASSKAAVGASTTVGWSAAGAYAALAITPAASSSTLTVTTQPSTATSGAAMSNVVITSSDSGFTGTVTAAIASGTGTLSGTTTATASAGVATFSNLILTGNGAHTLQFTASDHDPVTSASITVVPPVLERLRISFRP